MKILLQCLLFLGCNALAFSADILAWKTPISRIDTGGKASPKLVRLEKPPEASPFFGKDDELWNVSSIMPEEEGAEKLEWAVWNATTGRLVAKGSWVALFELQRHYDLNEQPIQCRMKLDAYSVPADGSPPDASKQPAFSLSYIARSGHKSVASDTEGESSISVESEVTVGEVSSVIDARILANISLPDCPNLQIDTSSSFANHQPVWYARNFDGKRGVDVMVTATPLLMDGTPFHEFIMRQVGEEIKAFSSSGIEIANSHIPIGGKHRLVSYWIPRDVLDSFYRVQSSGTENDPFSATAPAENSSPVYTEVKVPEILSPRFSGTVIDIKDLLKRFGLKILDEDFAGYDPKRQLIFMYTDNATNIDLLEQLLEPGDCGHAFNLMITSQGDGEMRLISRGGMKSSLTSLDLQSKQTRSMEVEPTVGENESIIDLRYVFEEKVGDKSIQSLDTSATLEAGKFLKLFEKGKADGTKEAMVVKVEVLGHDH